MVFMSFLDTQLSVWGALGEFPGRFGRYAWQGRGCCSSQKSHGGCMRAMSALPGYRLPSIQSAISANTNSNEPGTRKLSRPLVASTRRCLWGHAQNDVAAVGTIVGTTAALSLKLWHKGMQH